MPSRSSPDSFPLTSQWLDGVARLPGVYLMKDGADKILYVGKARDLRKRLASYAHYDREQPTKTAMLLAKIRRVETIITKTEKEALILEASLIKRHHPRYNVLLRDDKNYPLIKVTVAEAWPRVMMARRRVNDGARYFGPFSSSAAMRETLDLLNAIFPLRRCKGSEVVARQRPCLNHQIRRCPGPCIGKADPDQYAAVVANVLMVLEGKKDELVARLTRRMAEAAADFRYEEAALCRDWLEALRKTLEKQVVVADHHRDQDVIALVRREGAVAISILRVRQGRLEDHHAFFLADPMEEDPEILRQTLCRLYGGEWSVPHEVLVPFLPEDHELLVAWLADLRQGRVTLAIPRRGDRLTLLGMARANAEQLFADREKRQESWLAVAESLRRELGLRRLPHRIECLDNSNLGGEQAVGALVCFIEGEPRKKDYRHYKIRTVVGPDDYATMAEVLRRRFAREKGDGHPALPDLLLVDGGRGQVNVARAVLDDLGLAEVIELAGIAKERAGEGEKLYRPGRKNPILLPRQAPSLLLLMRVRDEAHRYGITFHRRWRRRDTLRSRLDAIPGLGPVRRRALLTAMGSVKRIEAATVDELAAVAGVGPELGRRIYESFRS